MIRRLPLVVVAALLALTLSAQSWTEDQGEQGTEADKLALGADVVERAGPPVGPPRTGETLELFTSEVASGLRCPACQGMSVDASPAETARNMKRQVRAMAAAGYDAFQIEEYFVGAYGEFVLMSPKKEGINLLVWVLPGVLIVLGAGVVLRVVSSRTRPPQETELPAPPPELEPYLARVRAELAERDG